MLNAKMPDNLLIKFQIMALRILKCEFDVAKMQKTKLKMMSKMCFWRGNVSLLNEG
jgi:hypothetical protein